MEHPCERCGAAVEDGTPFCPNCSAPQIRIVRETAPEAASAPRFDPGTPGELQPPAIPLRLESGQSPGRAGWRAAVSWGLAATVALLFSMASPPAFFVVAVFGFGFAGALAVNSYARRTHAPLTAGVGARIGAIAGLVGLIAIEIVAVASGLSAAYFKDNPELRSALQKQLQTAEPQVRDLMMRLLNHPGELAAMLAVVAFFYGLIFVGCGAVGGALRGRRSPR